MILPSVLDAMLAAGCTADQIVAAVKADALADSDREAEKREIDRLRQRRARDRKRSTETTVASEVSRGQTVTNSDSVTPPSPSPSPSPDKEIPPTPPKENNLFPLPPSTPHVSGARDLFESFWKLYPQKVGKADAKKAFEKALNRVDVQTMSAGLRQYVAKTDDRPWCNPATWLNQDRWNDQPAQARASPPRNESVIDRRTRELRERIANEHGIGREGNAGVEPDGDLLRLADHRGGN